MARPKISSPLSIQILYECARTCCVCRESERPVQIHHIDQDNTNNVESNLVALCSVCHGEAHTKHELSQNLTAERIVAIKAKWNGEVAKRAVNSMLPSKELDGALWTYIQHNRLHEIMERAGVKFDQPLFRTLLRNGIVDQFGVPQRLITPSKSSATWTVYDYLEYHQRHQVHHLLAKAIDHLISKTRPIDLDAIWKRRDIDTLVKPGTICFSQRAFYFRPTETNTQERFEKRLAFARAGKIKLELHISTRDMFGDSAVITNFVGHRTATCLFVAKSVTRESSEMVIHGTPIAMGTGSSARTATPYPENRRSYSWMGIAKSHDDDEDIDHDL